MVLRYLLVVAAPQLIFLAICARRSSRNSAVIGGLVALDAWLMFVVVVDASFEDIAGLGWFFYASCLAFVCNCWHGAW